MADLEFTHGDFGVPIDLEIFEGGEPLENPPTSITFRLKKPSGNVTNITLPLIDPVKARYRGKTGHGDLDEQGAMVAEVEVLAENGTDYYRHTETALSVFVRPEFVA